MNKAILAVCSLLTALALFFGWSLSDALSAPPSVSQVSSQSGHLIESLRYKASRPWRWPVQSARRRPCGSVDGISQPALYHALNGHGDKSGQQKHGRDLDRLRHRTQGFTLSIPQWNPDWRNVFFSNTPYESVPDG